MVVNTLAPESRRQLRLALQRERNRLRSYLRRPRATRRSPQPISEPGAGRILRPQRVVDDGAPALNWWTSGATPEPLLRERLTEVEAALRRLAAADFGICEACERPIEVERLRVRPWTRFCAVCAQGAAVGSPPDGRSLGG